MQLKRISFNFMAIGILACSIWAYVFLQQQKQAAISAQTETTVLVSQKDSGSHDTVLIVVDKKKAVKELTPELELLNFVLKKGREGIPVLLLKAIF